jgi:chromosome segregation ATPase
MNNKTTSKPLLSYLDMATTLAPPPSRNITTIKPKEPPKAAPKGGFSLQTQIPTADHRHGDLEAALKQLSKTLTQLTDEMKQLKRLNEKLTRKLDEEREEQVNFNIERDARVKVLEAHALTGCHFCGCRLDYYGELEKHRKKLKHERQGKW